MIGSIGGILGWDGASLLQLEHDSLFLLMSTDNPGQKMESWARADIADTP